MTGAAFRFRWAPRRGDRGGAGLAGTSFDTGSTLASGAELARLRGTAEA